MKNSLRKSERGVSLLEIMIAIFITAIGVLGAAAMQLNALKYTDSSRYTSQASFIVYDVIDRIRANADPAVLSGYSLADIDSAPATPTTIRDTDLADFASAARQLPGGEGSIVVSDTNVTVTVSWSEQRAGGQEADGTAKRSDVTVTSNVAGTQEAVAP